MCVSDRLFFFICAFLRRLFSLTFLDFELEIFIYLINHDGGHTEFILGVELIYVIIVIVQAVCIEGVIFILKI